MTRAPFMFPGGNWPVGSRRPLSPISESPARVEKRRKKEAELAEKARQIRIKELDAIKAQKAIEENKNRLHEHKMRISAEKMKLTAEKQRRKKKGFRRIPDDD